MFQHSMYVHVGLKVLKFLTLKPQILHCQYFEPIGALCICVMKLRSKQIARQIFCFPAVPKKFLCVSKTFTHMHIEVLLQRSQLSSFLDSFIIIYTNTHSTYVVGCIWTWRAIRIWICIIPSLKTRSAAYVFLYF